jgi:hypothetical protein
MKIFESQMSYELSVILTDDEQRKYSEAFRNQAPIRISELGDKIFIIKEMTGYHWDGAPENSWHLLIRQEYPEKQELD